MFWGHVLAYGLVFCTVGHPCVVGSGGDPRTYVGMPFKELAACQAEAEKQKHDQTHYWTCLPVPAQAQWKLR